jgi:hypothetical protein
MTRLAAIPDAPCLNAGGSWAVLLAIALPAALPVVALDDQRGDTALPAMARALSPLRAPPSLVPGALDDG